MTVTEHSNSYSHYLAANMAKITAMVHNKNCTVEALKTNIHNYIYPATYSYVDKSGKKQYTKKKWFMEQLDECTNSMEVYWLCYNSVKKANETLINH